MLENALRIVSIALFLIAAVATTIEDYRHSRIPNWAVLLIVISAVLGFVYSSVFDCALRLIVAGAMLLLIIPWKYGKIGAGDVKLLFACALFFNALCFLLSLIGATIAAALFSAFKKQKKIRYGAFYAPSAVVTIVVTIVIYLII